MKPEASARLREACPSRLGILNGTPRTATVRVTSDADADVLVVGKEDFMALVRGSAATQTEVWAMMSGRLADLESLNS